MLQRFANYIHIILLAEEEAFRPTRKQFAIAARLGISRADQQQFEGIAIANLKSHEHSFWCLVRYSANDGSGCKNVSELIPYGGIQ